MEIGDSEEGSGFSMQTLVVGSRGRMGRMLLSRAAENNLPVAGVDLPLDDSILQQECAGTDLALLCVPARNVREVAEKICPFLPARAILSDITSVKEMPMRQMAAVWPGAVVGTHPLFGPASQPDDDLPVAIVPGDHASPSDVEKVETFFERLGFRTFECTAARHDEAMARIQNMNFITNLAYFALLADNPDLLPFMTPSFLRRKNAAAKMLTEDAAMFAGLFEANPHSHETVRQYRKMLNVAASGDIDLLLRKAQRWWPDFEKDRLPQPLPANEKNSINYKNDQSGK